MPEVVREAVEGAEPVRIIFWGGRFGVKNKKRAASTEFPGCKQLGGKTLAVEIHCGFLDG